MGDVVRDIERGQHRYTYISGGWPGGDILGEWGRFVPPPPLTFVALFQQRVVGVRGADYAHHSILNLT